jgi:hypothetical protein
VAFVRSWLLRPGTDRGPKNVRSLAAFCVRGEAAQDDCELFDKCFNLCSSVFICG